MDEVENFFCHFLNPWALQVAGMGGYTSKCEKKSKSLHPTVHPYLVKSLLIYYHIIFSLILYTFKCAVVGEINNLFFSFFLSMRRYRVSHNALPKKITKKYSNNYYLVSLDIYGIPYIKKVTESKKITKNTVITIILSLWRYTEFHT